MKRRSTPTRTAAKRRKPGTNRAYCAPLPLTPIELRDYGGHAQDLKRVIAAAATRAPVEQLQRDVLEAVARLAPHVLTSLALLDGTDEAIERWAKRWRLNASWMHVAARNTLTLWEHWPGARGRRWDPNLPDRGMLVRSRGRLPRRPPELLVRAEHIEWFVLHRCLRCRYQEITTPHQTAAQAVARLSRLLAL